MINSNIQHLTLKRFGIIIYSILLSLYPILALYNFYSFINIGYLLLLVMLIIMIPTIKKISLDIKFIAIVCILSAFSIVMSYVFFRDITTQLNSFLAAVLLFSIISLAIKSGLIDINVFIKSAYCVVVFNTIMVLVQLVLYNFFGYKLYGNLPFLVPLEESFFTCISYGKPTGLFAEPAHLAIYFGPVLLISYIKKNNLMSFVCIIGLLFSTASTGLVLSVVVTFFYFLLAKRNNLLKNNILLVLFCIVMVFSLMIITEYFYSNYDKKFNYEYFATSGRLGGGISSLLKLKFSDLILGIGLNNIDQYLYINYGIVNTDYMNSILCILISYGVLGLLIYTIYFFREYIKPMKGVYSIFWIIFLFILFSDHIIFNRNYMYLYTWMLLILFNRKIEVN